MYEARRPEHRVVLAVLEALDAPFLESAACYFAGGTQIALALDEFRVSRDLDFLCASRAGFRQLRETVSETSLGRVLARPVPLAREVRADRDGIRTFLAVGERPLKLEIVREARIELQGHMDPVLRVPVLDGPCIVAEKLLANADRGLDDATHGRDLIDLAFLALRLGDEAVQAGLDLAEGAYGTAVRRYLGLALERFKRDRLRISRSAKALGIEGTASLRKGLTRLHKLGVVPSAT